MFVCDNQLITFGAQSTITTGFSPVTAGVALMFGSADRLLLYHVRVPTKVDSATGMNYTTAIMRYSASSSNSITAVLDFEVTFARDTSYQYIELRAGGTNDFGGVTGAWGLSDSFVFAPALGALQGGQSVVLQGDLYGRYWQAFNNSHLDIRMPLLFSGVGAPPLLPA